MVALEVAPSLKFTSQLRKKNNVGNGNKTKKKKNLSSSTSRANSQTKQQMNGNIDVTSKQLTNDRNSTIALNQRKFRAKPMKSSPPSMSQLSRGVGANSNPTMAAGGSSIFPAVEATKEALRVLLDPFSDSVVARWADSYTLIPTAVSKDAIHRNITLLQDPLNEEVYCFGLYFRGDPTNTLHMSSIDSSTSSSLLGQLTWNTGLAEHLRDSIPSYESAFGWARPTGAGVKITYSSVGPYHSGVIRILELPPYPMDMATHPVGFPTLPSLGPTFMQREFLRAREMPMDPGDTIQANVYPVDPACLIFGDALSQRDSYHEGLWANTKSWSGLVIWGYGFQATDTVYLDACIHHEWYVPHPVLIGQTVAPNKAIVRPSTVVTERALDTVTDVVSQGTNIFKTIYGIGKDIWSVLSPILSAVPSPALQFSPFSGNMPLSLPKGMGLGEFLTNVSDQPNPVLKGVADRKILPLVQETKDDFEQVRRMSVQSPHPAAARK